MTRMAMAFRVACPNPSSLLDLLIAAIDADYPTDSQLGGLQPEMQLSHDLPLICICGSVSAPAADIVGSGSERNQAESRAPHCSHKQCHFLPSGGHSPLVGGHSFNAVFSAVGRYWDGWNN